MNTDFLRSLSPRLRLLLAFVALVLFALGVLVGANLMTIRDAVVTGAGAILPALGHTMTGSRP